MDNREQWSTHSPRYTHWQEALRSLSFERIERFHSSTSAQANSSRRRTQKSAKQAKSAKQKQHPEGCWSIRSSRNGRSVQSGNENEALNSALTNPERTKAKNARTEPRDDDGDGTLRHRTRKNRFPFISHQLLFNLVEVSFLTDFKRLILALSHFTSARWDEVGRFSPPLAAFHPFLFAFFCFVFFFWFSDGVPAGWTLIFSPFSGASRTLKLERQQPHRFAPFSPCRVRA